MEHRHLTHQRLTLAAVDDIICRGNLADWGQLRAAVQQDPEILKKLLRICMAHVDDPYAQRYHFWWHYAQRASA